MVLPRATFPTIKTTSSIIPRATTTTNHSAAQCLARRTYATEQRQAAKKASSLPWLMGGVGLGIPTIAYAVNTGTRSEDKMHWPVARGGSGKGDTTPSDVDPAQATKYPEGEGTMSRKQAGLDNYNSSNPFITAPGKSVKGEGDTETTKLQGTVDPHRRPA